LTDVVVTICKMSVTDNLVAVFTILASLLVVVTTVGAAWWLMWKVFLSRFQFVNELLFPPTGQEEKQKSVARRKIRKD